MRVAPAGLRRRTDDAILCRDEARQTEGMARLRSFSSLLPCGLRGRAYVIGRQARHQAPGGGSKGRYGMRDLEHGMMM